LIHRLAILIVVLTVSLSAQTESHTAWPVKDGTYVIKNFRFGTGETFPELKLHYLTLGEPHRD